MATSAVVKRGLGATLWIVVVLAGSCNRQQAVEPSTTNAPAAQQNDSPLFDFPLPAPTKPSSHSEPAPSEAGGCSQFTDVAAALGLEFIYQNGERGQSLMVETLGGGVGCLDYDGDGRLDLFFSQGGDPVADGGPEQPSDALFRQAADGAFLDVSKAAGIAEHRYSQGVAIGDFDNDGFDDVYITNVGKNVLLRNQGDGTFLDVTDAAGVGDPRWSSSAAFADINQDGHLDLYVCNYVIYDPKNPKDCRDTKGRPRICHPKDVDPWPDECFINQGDGRFEPQARQLGLFGEGNKALGVVVADFNNDRLPDIYIANDTTANFLFMNQGAGVFQEQALLLGCAVDRNGAFQASMGLAVGDYDRNGLLDIYSTHFYEESNTLYRNFGAAGFEDVTGFAGLHDPTMLRLGFGTVMEDFDQDGWQELFVANGHIENYPGNPIHKMRPQFFAFNGARWRECTDEAGEYFADKYVGRGVARCDFNGDGAPDLVVSHQNAPAALLRNDSERGHWLKLRFRGRESNRRGIGCRVVVEGDDMRLVQELYGGGSYASSHEPALFFGLGEASGPVRVHVLWPSGATQVLERVSVDQTVHVDEKGVAEAPSSPP